MTLVTPRVGEDEAANDWARSLAAADAGAIYMGVGQAGVIASALIAAGKAASTPVAVVENASLPNWRVVHTTLAALPAVGETTGPAVILVGPQYRPQALTRKGIDATIVDAVAVEKRRA